MSESPYIEITVMYDGWSCFLDFGQDKCGTISFDHEDEDLGSVALTKILQALGHNPVVKEDY